MRFAFRVVGYPLAFVAGAFAIWLTMDNIHKPFRAYIKPVIIESLDIVPKHRWILNYQVSVSNLDVDSRRDYMLIILTPLEKFRPDDLKTPEQLSRFVLNNLSDPDSSWTLDLGMEKIRESSNSQFIGLKEYWGSLSDQERIYQPGLLELKSQDSRSYPPVPSDRSKYKFEGKQWHLK